jgi:hypothetical protein
MAQAAGKVPVKFRRLKQVTFPTLKVNGETPYYFKFTSPIQDGRAQTKAGEDGKPMKPARVALVVDMDTGQSGQIIVPAVLERIMQDNYPGDSYVGKGFEIVKHLPANGKRYSTFDVNEVATD